MMRLLLFLLTTTVFSQNEFSTIENFLYVENEIQVWSNENKTLLWLVQINYPQSLMLGIIQGIIIYQTDLVMFMILH